MKKTNEHPEAEQTLSSDAVITITAKTENGASKTNIEASKFSAEDLLFLFSSIARAIAKSLREDAEMKKGMAISLLIKSARVGVEDEYEGHPEASDDPLSQLLSALRRAAEGKLIDSADK